MNNIPTHTPLPIPTPTSCGALPARSAQARTAAALRWIVSQHEDITDQFFAMLPPADHTSLALGFTANTSMLQGPKSLQTTAFSYSAMAIIPEQGPLRSALLAGLSGDGKYPPQSSHWTALHARRYSASFHQALQAAHQTASVRYAQAASQPLFKDITLALLALDRMSEAAPQTRWWRTVENGRVHHAASSRGPRRKAGGDALLYALDFSAKMQSTLLAHVVVGCALAFLGRTEAAESVFAKTLAPRFAQALERGQQERGLHAAQMYQEPEAFPDRCLMWLKAAALAADSAAIYKIYLQLLDRVPALNHHYKDPPDLNERWPILVTGTHLGREACDSDPDLEWAQAMGHSNLVTYIHQHSRI